MALREYKCNDCGTHSDSIERSPEDILKLCPKCGSENIERVITSYGGYFGDLGSASTKPKGSGSFRK